MSGIGTARGVFLSTLLASTALTTVAFAADSGGIETVVVTAEKRTENMQHVPISIQVLGTQKIEELHIQNFTDYAAMLPSVSFSPNAAGGGLNDPGFANVYFRGITSGNDGNHSGSLPSVGIYLDEQPITTIGGALDIHTYDIARVEALAGPPSDVPAIHFPTGTRVNDVRLNGSTVTVDLSQDVTKDAGGSFGENGEFKALVYTMTAISGIDAVQVLVQGNRLETLPGGHLELDEPLRRADW